MAPSFQWWAKESHRGGTPVVVKMENPNWFMLELESPSEDDFLPRRGGGGGSNGGNRRGDKGRGRNVKQLTWVLLLRAHKAVGCVASIGSTMFSVFSPIRRRVTSGRTDEEERENEIERNENHTVKSKFYSCIKLFLWLSVVLLGFEIAVYFNGWHFGAPHLQLQHLLTTTTPFEVQGFFDFLYSRWVLIRVEYLAPPLQFLANACIVLFLIQSVDRLILCLGCFWIRFKKIKPVPKSMSSSVRDIESSEGNADSD